MRMKLLLLILLVGLTKPSKAFDFDGLEVLIPLADVYAGAFYDFVGKETVGAVETPILRHRDVKNVSLTIGAAGDLSDEGEGELRERFREFLESGTPYIGLNYQLPIFKDRVFLSGGWGINLKEGKSLAGLNSSFKFW